MILSAGGYRPSKTVLDTIPPCNSQVSLHFLRTLKEYIEDHTPADKNVFAKATKHSLIPNRFPLIPPLHINTKLGTQESSTSQNVV